MTSHVRRFARRIFGSAGLASMSTALLTTLAMPALADVNLRVEGRPPSEPIQAFVRVTDELGEPIEGLTPDDFAVTIDGEAVTISGVTLPPEQSDQRVSIIFAMDYSLSVTDVALGTVQQAVIDFAEQMTDGDQAAIIKFNDSNPARASVVLPFTTIDHGANNAAIEAAVLADYPGDGTNLLDALELAVNHFLAPPAPLPSGPKAIILISDGGENESEVSEFEVVQLASENSIPIFTIGVGDLTIPSRVTLMTDLATDTGGQFFPTATDEEVAAAYASIELLLTNEYLVTIPNGITDCAVHTMEVTVTDQAAPATAQFTRRVCDAEPNPFSFTAQTGVEPSASATSNAVTIGGLEVESHVSVIVGEYSIGCSDTFTDNPGTIADGETVCVRQTTAGNFSTSKTTTLTIGGVAGTFTTTTLANPDDGGNGGGGGGGGAMGFVVLFGLGCLLLARRRLA